MLGIFRTCLLIVLMAAGASCAFEESTRPRENKLLQGPITNAAYLLHESDFNDSDILEAHLILMRLKLFQAMSQRGYQSIFSSSGASVRSIFPELDAATATRNHFAGFLEELSQTTEQLGNLLIHLVYHGTRCGMLGNADGAGGYSVDGILLLRNFLSTVGLLKEKLRIKRVTVILESCYASYTTDQLTRADLASAGVREVIVLPSSSATETTETFSLHNGLIDFWENPTAYDFSSLYKSLQGAGVTGKPLYYGDASIPLAFNTFDSTKHNTFHLVSTIPQASLKEESAFAFRENEDEEPLRFDEYCTAELSGATGEQYISENKAYFSGTPADRAANDIPAAMNAIRPYIEGEAPLVRWRGSFNYLTSSTWTDPDFREKARRVAFCMKPHQVDFYGPVNMEHDPSACGAQDN